MVVFFCQPSKISPSGPPGRYLNDPNHREFLFGNFFLCGGFGEAWSTFPGYVGKIIETRILKTTYMLGVASSLVKLHDS